MPKSDLFSTIHERCLLARWSKGNAASHELNYHYETLRGRHVLLSFAALTVSAVTSFSPLSAEGHLAAQFAILALAGPVAYGNERKRMMLQPMVQLYRATEDLQEAKDNMQGLVTIAGGTHISGRTPFADHLQAQDAILQRAYIAFHDACDAYETYESPRSSIYRRLLNLPRITVAQPSVFQNTVRVLRA